MSSLILHTSPAAVHTVLHSPTVPPAGNIQLQVTGIRLTDSQILICNETESKAENIVRSVRCNSVGLKMSH